MAHYEKFGRQGLGHLFIHCRRGFTMENGERKYAKFSNKEIDTSRSHLNYNLCINENGVAANQHKRYERILRGETLPEGYSLKINKRKDLKVVCSWIVTLPEDVKEGDERRFFQSVYNHLKKEYPHVISAWVHNDEAGRPHLHYLFCPIFYDKKKDIYKISANELIDRNALNCFHDRLSKAVENDLGYATSVMTGESTLRREQGLRGSIDILKYKAQKMAEEYSKLKDRFQGEGLKLSADMADFIVGTGQKERFLHFQKEKDKEEERVYGER